MLGYTCCICLIATPAGDQSERRVLVIAVLRISPNAAVKADATCCGVGIISALPWVASAIERSSAASQSVPTPQALILIFASAQRATDRLSAARFSPSFLPSVRNRILAARV